MKKVTDFEELLKEKYGEKGNPTRDKFDADSLAFRLGIMLKEVRQEAKISQSQAGRKN